MNDVLKEKKYRPFSYAHVVVYPGLQSGSFFFFTARKTFADILSPLTVNTRAGMIYIGLNINMIFIIIALRGVM